jgi:hypothetical protein
LYLLVTAAIVVLAAAMRRPPGSRRQSAEDPTPRMFVGDGDFSCARPRDVEDDWYWEHYLAH